MHCCSICLVVCLFLQCQSFVNQTSDKLCIYRDLVPLEAFWVVGCRGDVWLSERSVYGVCRVLVVVIRNSTRKSGWKEDLPIVPNAVVHHVQRSCCVFVVKRESVRVEELDDGRAGCRSHPDE